jgi:hypothetical protein
MIWPGYEPGRRGCTSLRGQGRMRVGPVPARGPYFRLGMDIVFLYSSY